MTLDHHQLAIISLTGSTLDVIGALYLAYDLLGGKHGPLRTITRAVTYSIMFTAGFTLAFGLAFGFCVGVSSGVTIAIELARQSRESAPYAFGWEVAFSAIRAFGFGLGASFIYGPEFGVVFGTLSLLGQAFAYWRGFRPGMDYEAKRRPRITRGQLIAAVNRTVGYGVAGCISAIVAHRQAQWVLLGVTMGLGTGAVTAVFTAVAPYVEWFAETLRERTLGAAGVGLIFVGFSLQSVQYWVALFDVPVR